MCCVEVKRSKGVHSVRSEKGKSRTEVQKKWGLVKGKKKCLKKFRDL